MNDSTMRSIMPNITNRNSDMENQLLLTRDQVAGLLGNSVRGLINLEGAGLIKPIRLNRSVRYRAQTWKRRLPNSPSKPPPLL